MMVALCSIHTAIAQQEDTNNDANITPTNLAKAKFQINDIKGRGIIVRLKTNKDRIAAYRKEGYNKAADKLDEKSKITNLLITYAFVTKWTYGPLYFMESQYTTKLMQENLLMAKTLDLARDTAIPISKDSFYIVDFGDLMANVPLDPNNTIKNINKTQQSEIPVGGSYYVIKDHDQQQLQQPMPYFTKVVFEDFNSTANMQPIEIPASLSDSITVLLNKYPTTTELIKSEAKATVTRYLNLFYDHIAATQSGNRYEKAAGHFNQHFIDYYCKRLDKDRNIIGNNNDYYWWLRNPNIRYLSALPQIERQLKSYMDKDPKFIKTY